MASVLKPFAPVIFDYITKTVWQISHRNHVKNMTGRVNWLIELADMAKHNNPKQNNTPQPDASKVSSGSFCVIPKFNYTFSFNHTGERYFSNYLSSVSLVFIQITAPPPKES